MLDNLPRLEHSRAVGHKAPPAALCANFLANAKAAEFPAGEDTVKGSFRGVGLALCLVATLAEAAPQDAATSAPHPWETKVKKILADRLGETNQGIGVVVGMINDKGRRIVGYGNFSKDDKRLLDGNTVFEIGSITKVFTALLLMDMAQKGEVSVADSIAQYLPKDVSAPERNGRTITLEDLATHRSGLPWDPPNVVVRSGGYTVQQLYEFLGSYRLPRDIRSEFAYSNLGAGLLGHVLSLRAGQNFAALLRARLLGPLGMDDTSITLSPEMMSRLAVGHDTYFAPVAKMDFSLRMPLAPGGGLSSTANELLTFLAANLGYTRTSLAAAMSAQISIRRPTAPSIPDGEIAYGWFIQTKKERTIVSHSGATLGFRSYIGFDPGERVGVVILSNRYGSSFTDDLGRTKPIHFPEQYDCVAFALLPVRVVDLPGPA